MDDVNFIAREPLLNRKGEVLGYELTWQQNRTDAGMVGENDANSLIAAIAEQRYDTNAAWQLGDNVLFLNAACASLSPEVIRVLSPKNTVFRVHSADFADPDTLAAVKALRAQGFGISLADADLAASDKSLLAFVTHIEACFDAADFVTQLHLYKPLQQSSLRMVVREVGTWQNFDFCASMGLDIFIGNLYLEPWPGNTSKGLNPAQTMILQLMQLVRQNADVRQLEDVLRHDAALSYQLLLHINRVGFGLGTEIQSLRHAVTMLGYSPLYRWLSLLLPKAGNTSYSPALMQTAVIRGRFTELLSRGFLRKSEAENLFVVGMFSLLDRLLGIPMEEVLENTHLSDTVSQALLSRGGVYGPFLALAEACELRDGRAGELADALFINACQVNEAHLSALAWAQNLKF